MTLRDWLSGKSERASTTDILHGSDNARSSINLGNTRRFCILNELCKFILRDMISTRYVVCSSIFRFYTMHTVQKGEWTDIYGEMRFLYFVYLAVKRFWT